ncbi:hypothetical protein [uncultured Catenibacterium sp.]|uniref:hypothetical protein n=1 Tax=uncultured Catenibacterium sp. TaxID=286142 RepID=UPI0025D040C0|nr:hypothetical protein [uncultured Catenibacterium sp.]
MEEKYGPECIGKVIRIIDDTEIIINAGEDILTIGDKITIYAIGDEITDLDGTSLGYYECDKATLTVATTTQHYSICKTEKKYKKSTLGVITNFSTDVFMGYEHISIDQEQAKPILIKNKDKVQVGDLVKKY